MSHRRNADDPWPSYAEISEALRNGTGKGVKVAVIDSGVEASHPRLSGLSISDSVAFEEIVGTIHTLENQTDDHFGHGTAVAGIIHQFTPKAEIGSFRVIDARSVSRSHLICAGVREAIRSIGIGITSGGGGRGGGGGRPSTIESL